MTTTEPAPTAQHERMAARLAELDEERRRKKDEREMERKEAADPRESTKEFLDSFRGREAELKAAIEGVNVPNAASSTGAAAGQAADAKAQFEALSESISELQQSCAEACYFLPAFEQRNCLAATQALRELLEKKKLAVAPRKKFAFSRGGKTSGAQLASKAQATAAQAAQQAAAAPSSAPQHPNGTGVAPSVDVLDFPAGRGLRDLDGETRAVPASELDGVDYNLSNLRNCTIFLAGRMQALRLHKLEGCTIVAGPVLGSTFCDGLRGCKVHLATFQTRIHSTRDTDFFLRLRSRPIIEHTAAVRFGPADLAAACGAAALRDAGLADENGMWANVDDFAWIKAVASPNWSQVPQGECVAAPRAPGAAADAPDEI
ncbi:unnamed protein product [Pedinophyceae sp. YPF-701]|nr:unnamed protein product [Pedinophyceae sp. YPF-701]